MLSDRPRGALSETRKITKSAMEKKRRARINTSLVELKTILGGMLSHKTERFDKMEKADILEMTVRYVKQLQRKSEQASSPTKNKDEDYKNGVNSCISEVIKYIASSHSCDEEIKAKLLDHLANRLTGADEPSSRHDYKSAMSSSSDSDMSDSDSCLTDSPSETKSIHKPVTVNTHTVCPTAIALSPGTNANQIIQGQFAGTTLQTSPVVNTLQQTSPIAPNIPFTIIVPANLYSSVGGTACVIPLSIPTTAGTHVTATSAPLNNLVHTVSPVTQQQSASSRTDLCGQQPTQCVANNAVVNNADLKSDALREESVVKTNDLCNKETSSKVLKENFHIQAPNCLRSQHSPVINSMSKEQMRAENMWRPW